MSRERTIGNPLIGDRVTFLVTAAESDRQYELVEVELNPGGGNGLHYHTSFEEEFEALEGLLYIDCDGRTHVLKPGEKLVAPRRSVHRFYNPGHEKIRFKVRIVPARSFEPLLRIAYGLTNDGRTNGKGVPRNLLEMAVIFHLGESYLPNLPFVVQKGLFAPLHALAVWFGVKKRLLRRYA